MSTPGLKVSEDAFAEQPALEWLLDCGWSYLHGAEVAPDAGSGERTHWSDVVLMQSLRAAVERLNPQLSCAAVTRVVELVLTGTSPSLIRDHYDFHQLLLSGMPISWLDDEGMERSTRANLIDWKDPAHNDFQAINQFKIVQGTKNRRPDILLFVNGLPLGQIELKNPADETATPESAVNQVAHYRETIPQLYRFVEIIGVSDLLKARVGTITTPKEHFAEWKTMDPDESAGRSQLEVMIREVFEPAALLELIRNFVLFETDGVRTWKVMAKYHQVDAVNRAVRATAEAMAGDQRAGVVWHTQGAGKSYSMVFYVTKLRRDERFANPTVVCVTDTNDLDNQLMETFARQAHLAPVVDQADRIQGGEKSLYELLDVPADGIVFTTIQKFGRRNDEGPMPVLSKRRNVIVIADEAHRSQYAGLAQNLQSALPNATRIGFTGTPIERADRNTRLAFGDYISVYRMGRAQEDGATVPIYYESRQVPVEVEDQNALRKVEEVLETEEPTAADQLTTAWAQLEKVVGAPERLDRVVEDLVAHYIERCKTLPGKAMLVAYSRRVAAEYVERLGKKLEPDAVTAVITASATEDPVLSKYRRSKQEMRQLEEDFKNPDSPLRVVVVKNMWLTGFDAPVLHTLYIDRPMRDHGLLQAIARVNRVFREKPGGLVVDYIGIGDDLRSSLEAYSAGDVDDVVVPLEIAAKKLIEKHEVMLDLLHGVDFHSSSGASAGEKATKLAYATEQAVARYVLDDERAQLFLSEQSQYARWFALVSPNEPTVSQRFDHDFFATVAKVLRMALIEEGTTSGPASAQAEQAVKQFFSEGLGAGEIVDVFEIAGADRPEISVLSDEFLDNIGTRVSQPELQVALLRKLLKNEVSVRLRANQTQAKHFSDALAAVLARYESRQITSAEVVAQLVELAKELRAAHKRHDDLNLSEEEAAFYDALAGHSDDWTADETLKAIASDLVRSIKADLSVDWADRANTEAAIRSKIKRLLRKPEYREAVKAIANAQAANGDGGGGGIDLVAQRVFNQARALYRYWPEVETGRLFEHY
jgi:type I restriction enzyme, R subunit